MRLLTEEAAPTAIREMLRSAPFTKLAVAFWGIDAVRRLGIGRDGFKAKIICNLESGACNPAEIRQLLALPQHVEVRTNPRLHAKVYWTAQGAVVGSSNASSNGLALEGRELSSWAEANLLVDDHIILEELSKWFDRLFSESTLITDDKLAKAEVAWKMRRDMRPAPVATPFPKAAQTDPSVGDKPSLAKFETAMRNIYHEAKAAGYTASGYWTMLQEQGAMNTARRLVLAPQPSPGFGELLLLNRLDLTVESLIVREPWRRLFEPEVLVAAQKRLDSMRRK